MTNPAPKPDNEAARLRALSEYRILGTKPEDGYDNITSMAALICHAPIASDLDCRSRPSVVQIQSRTGNGRNTERLKSFCAHTILSPKPMIVEDALSDERFKDNPLVKNEPHIRLYAGFPLHTNTHHRIGTLCVIDRTPKSLTSTQYKIMERLAAQVVTLLELRKRSMSLLDEFCKLHQQKGNVVLVQLLPPGSRQPGDVASFRAIHDALQHTEFQSRNL